MKNKIEEMRSAYGLSEEGSLLTMLDDFKDEEIRRYCRMVLRTYSDLKKEDWSIGMEGGDYIYSFAGNHVFITDDIWSFDLVAKPEVLQLLADKMRALKKLSEKT
ncbi:hypothetical protein [Pedobacter sp. FW305-3-2-15-E-R2A2]|uniref:hypothetical protein n=1 Tax=Pedobacter sp. FW305-3-2-15-E-R2A2 TaxID=3140251 RepID=UPI00314058DF